MKSRKQHGNTTRPIPILFPTLANDPVMIEPRAIGVNHKIVFHYSQPITDAGSVTTTAGTATADRNNNEVIVTLTNIADTPRVTWHCKA